MSNTLNTPPPAGIAVQDAAWVRVPTSMSVAELATHLGDPEALLRLNPYYYFKTLKLLEHGGFHADFENQSNQQQVVADITVTRLSDSALSLNYSQGMKTRTVFTVEAMPQGSYLVVTDDYSGTSESERQARAAEVDKSLNAWGEALRRYFVRLQRYSRVPGWRWYIRRVWIPMKPSGRRIVWLLSMISLVEFGFFCFVLLIVLVRHIN